MNSLMKSLTHWFSPGPLTAQDRDDEYLSQSVDIYDLERRMRQLDSSQHNLVSIGSYGILMT